MWMGSFGETISKLWGPLKRGPGDNLFCNRTSWGSTVKISSAEEFRETNPVGFRTEDVVNRSAGVKSGGEGLQNRKVIYASNKTLGESHLGNMCSTVLGDIKDGGMRVWESGEWVKVFTSNITRESLRGVEGPGVIVVEFRENSARFEPDIGGDATGTLWEAGGACKLLAGLAWSWLELWYTDIEVDGVYGTPKIMIKNRVLWHRGRTYFGGGENR